MKLLTISSPVSKSLEFQDKMVSGCWDDPDRGGHDSREVHYGQLQGQDDLGICVNLRFQYLIFMSNVSHTVQYVYVSKLSFVCCLKSI